MRKYRLVAKKGEGTFSEVLKAQNVKDGKYHAIKCMKNRFESIDQVNNLREIQALRRLSPHDHIITLEEVLYDQPTGRLALVFELMDANLYEIIRGRKQYLDPRLLKSYMWQLMKSLDHMHKKGIFHRDIKPENILIESGTELGKGLKLADFGSCRGIYSKQPYTEYISTRWYRSPECLLTDGYYGPEMDLWGAGCVMFEITSLYPLFPGANEADQINRIHKVLGTPNAEALKKLKSKGASHISFDFPEQKGTGIAQLVPNATPDALDLMIRLLKYDGSERITAREAMRHPYLKEMREIDAKRTETVDIQNNSTTPKASNGASNSDQKTVKSNGPSLLSNVNNANNNIGGSKLAQQQPKALPTISGASGTNAENYLRQPQLVTLKPNLAVKQSISSNQTTVATNSTNPSSNSTVTNTAVAGGSLPPIQGHNGMFSIQQNQKQYVTDNKSIRNIYSNNNTNNNTNGSNSNSTGVNSNTLKKKKKNKSNLQNAEQVMRAYGIQRNNVITNPNESAVKLQSNIVSNGNTGGQFNYQSNRYSQSNKK